MGIRSLLALLSLVSLVSVAGCNKDPTKVVPETRGKRGENCQARNDCQDGLACLNGFCAKNEFDIDVASKQCDRIDCAETADCCGGKPTEAPKRCSKRDQVCTPLIANCVQTQTCTSDSQCGDGTCRPAGTGSCSGGNLTGLTCQTAAECSETCNTTTNTCTRSAGTCTTNADCIYYSATATCLLPARTCNCTNPDYNSADPICTDVDCVDLCLLRCESERCVTDLSCDTNADCTGNARFCVSDRCVQCKSSTDCGDDEECEEGVCHKPCQHNEECPLFYACDDKSGECEYQGCKSDRECVLSANRANAENPESVSTTSGEDARLLKCLPSESEPNIKTCKIPCENDGSCGAQSVCDKGYCKFIGCENNEECRAYLGIANQVPTDAKPYVSTAVCRAVPTTK